MKVLRTLIYSISSILTLLIVSTTANAQNDSIASVSTDSIQYKQKYGLRVGADLSKLGRSFLDDTYSGFEIMADYRLKNRLYLAGELGFDEKDNVTDYLDITTKGSYIKAGIDYNMYQNWLDMDNLIYAGFRLGFSSFSHDLNSYTIYNSNLYWSPQFTSNETTEYKGLTAIWTELILGAKVEILNNLYLGINVQFKLMVSETEPDNFQNVYVPGFYKTFDSTGIGVGYGYNIAYRIPLYKKAK